MKRLLILLAFLAAPAFAETLATTSRGIVVARPNRVELYDLNGRSVLWSTDGVRNASTIVVGDDRIAVLDAIANEARVIELANGRGATTRTGETPIGGVFVERELYVLERDARTLTNLGRKSVSTGADPAFVREANGRLYVYSRVDGLLQEYDPSPLRMLRRVQVAPFASDFELDAKNAYLVFPREAKIRTVSLNTLQPLGAVDVGAVPVDLAFTSGSSAISARTIAVADPSAKRVWLVEGAQSMTQAVTRGFIRGLLGLGLYQNRGSELPTGVDRVWARGSKWIAYDSSTGTLYRFTKAKSTVLAKDVAASGFTLTADSVAVWQNGRLRLISF